MARKKVAFEEEEILEAPAPVRTRPVKVNQVTRREYTEDEPVTDAEIIEDDTEDDFPDPFAAFNEIVSNAHNATLRIWRLPNYDTDGRTAINGVEREYCGSVVYNPNNAAMVDQIHGRVPAGGMLSLELLADGQIRKRGLLRLMKNPNLTAAPGVAPVTIQQMPPPVAPPIDPMTFVKQQAESFLAVANVIKQLQPEQAAAPAPVAQAEPVSIRDRMLEGVILKMVESPKPDSLERVADLLSGKEGGGWVEATITSIGPHLGQFLTQIGPGLGAYFMRLASGGPVATGAPQLNAAGDVIANPPPPPPVTDPAERAWRRMMGRLLDDLFEHVNLVGSGQLGLDVHSSAEAVADLAGRFADNQTIVPIIQQLISVSPEQVIDLCCMMLPPQATERLTPMKQSHPALEWLSELQLETRTILTEGEGEAIGDRGPETAGEEEVIET